MSTIVPAKSSAIGNCYLVQFDKLERDEEAQPMELHTLGELSAICPNCDQKLANLFRSRDDTMRWIAWLTKPKVGRTVGEGSAFGEDTFNDAHHIVGWHSTTRS
jgi:hypothetical protein